MTTIPERVTTAYEAFLARGDPQVRSWFFMESPVPIVTLVFLYVLFVKKIGPLWMADKKPFNLRYQMVFYNFALVVANLVIFKQAMDVLLTSDYNFTCRVDNTRQPGDKKMIELAWWFLMTRFFEFADTVFFVLRKKYNQISILHVIHHSVVPLAVWLVLRIESDSTYNYFFPLINLLVHIIMYSYYGLAALGPRVQRYLWWKKYLTTLQMVQFVSVFFFYMMLVVTNCVVSKFTISVNISLAALFLGMFYNFFRNTYLRNRTSTKEKIPAWKQVASKERKVMDEDVQVGKKSH